MVLSSVIDMYGCITGTCLLNVPILNEALTSLGGHMSIIPHSFKIMIIKPV